MFLVEIDDVIAAVKRPEKRNLQPTDIRTFDEIRPTCRFPTFPLSGIEASVHHLDAAVLPKAISRGDAGQIPFERMIDACDFVPGAEISPYLKSLNRRNALGNAGTSRSNTAARKTSSFIASRPVSYLEN